jgi:hypothetical protein
MRVEFKLSRQTKNLLARLASVLSALTDSYSPDRELFSDLRVENSKLILENLVLTPDGALHRVKKINENLLVLDRLIIAGKTK